MYGAVNDPLLTSVLWLCVVLTPVVNVRTIVMMKTISRFFMFYLRINNMYAKNALLFIIFSIKNAALRV